jgi:macrolide-specific efflux system membrane fusion protein
MDRLRLTVEKSILEVEQAEHELEVARETALIKENELEAAQEDLRRRRILAPLDGVVVQVNRHAGEWVEPGDAVVRVLRIDPLRAEGFLKVDDLKHAPLGRPVSVRVRLPGGQQVAFTGKIVFIAPEIDPVNAQIRVWADIENRDLKLRPGMRAEMVIDVSPRKVSE